MGSIEDSSGQAGNVAGLVSETAGRIPQAGEVIEVYGLRFEILASIGFVDGERRSNGVNRLADAVEGDLSVGPAEQIVSSCVPAPARFDYGEAGKQPPIQTVGIGLGYKYVGIILIGTMFVLQKFAEDGLAQIELFAILRYVLLALRRGSRNTEDSCENHKTGGQKALHNNVVLLGVNFRWNGLS